MTTLDQLVEAGARALAAHRESSWDDYEWEQIPERTRLLFCEQQRASLLAILPLLADDLAGAVAWAHMVPPDGGSPTDDEKAVADNAADIIRTRISSLMEGKPA